MLKWLRCRLEMKKAANKLLFFIFITLILKLLDMALEYGILYILNTIF